MQTPRRVQWSSSRVVGMRIIMRKLVECPVVASTPFLAAVRYTGQEYVCPGTMSLASTGLSQMHGAGSKSTFGLDSHRIFSVLSHAHPSRYIPYT